MPAAPASPGGSAAQAPTAAAASSPPSEPAAPEPAIVLHGGGAEAAHGTSGVVTSVETNATRVGVEVLEGGGNAIDAAVAVGYALAVTHPSAGNIGGGGFMIVRLANGEVHAIDFREMAPAAATTEGILAMIDAGGFGYASVAVPGTVAGLGYARDHFGTMPLATLVAPAIKLAREGYKLGHRQAELLAWAWPKLSSDVTARAVFGRGKNPLAEGHRLRQPGLAKTLEAIAARGNAGFYEGPIADQIAASMRAHGGLVTKDDLRAYAAKERSPLRFRYRGLDVDTMPPPSMGGVALAEIMLALERSRAHERVVDSGASLHLFVEAARRAYADRREVGADPDQNSPAMLSSRLPELLESARLGTRLPRIDPEHATPSSALVASLGTNTQESPQTTHFSIVDALGNAVSCTYTQSASYGSKVVVPEIGVVLNNSLGAFSTSGPNVVSKGKRMASSMTPTVVSQRGKLALVLGSPGGDTIPNTVAQVLRNTVDYGMTIDRAIAHPRIHEQFLPDKVRIEKTNPPLREAIDDLVRRGHTIDVEETPIGDANNVLIDTDGVAWAAYDAREGGRAMAARSHRGDRTQP